MQKEGDKKQISHFESALKKFTDNIRKGWKFANEFNLLEKAKQAHLPQKISQLWKFMNEYSLLDKFKETKLPQAIKIGGLALLLSGKSLDVKAVGETKPSDRISEKTEIPVEKITDFSTDKCLTSASFRAYSGKYYNEICNGSPCWLASTYETKGSGIGKNVSSVAAWNDRGNYRGLNQISPDHARKFFSWLKSQESFQSVYNSLRQNGIEKAGWQKTAKQHEHLMTEAFEWYMVKKYSPDNFKVIQEKLNQKKVNLNLKKFHPVVLSVMHQLMVELPSRRSRIAQKIIDYQKTHHSDERVFASDEFINILTPNAAIRKQAKKLLKDSTIAWKKEQFLALNEKSKPVYDDGKTWFDIQGDTQTMLAEQQKPKDDSAHLMIHPKSVSLSQEATKSNPIPTAIKLADSQSLSSSKNPHRRSSKPVIHKSNPAVLTMRQNKKKSSRG